MEQSPDPRHNIYSKLHGNQLNRDRDMNTHSAEAILRIAFEYIQAKSMLDIGCGLGTWLHVGQEMGLEVAGIEGPWCEIDKLEVDKSLVTITDLEQPIDLGRKFDLAISLEVGEHLSIEAAPNLVKALTSHADQIIYSAAIPLQGGHHHVNEQFPGFWVELFAAEGFLPVDLFRAVIWTDSSIHWWLRQNTILFAKPEIIDANPRLKAESMVNRPLDLVHPEVYFRVFNALQHQMRQLQDVLLKSGLAKIRNTPQGQVFELR